MSCRRTIIRLSAVLAVVALTKGCGDGDSPAAPPTPEPARPTTVTVSPATHELTALGTTVQLSAEVRDQNARVMAGATVTWTSSANSVATVDASGLVTAAGNGTRVHDTDRASRVATLSIFHACRRHYPGGNQPVVPSLSSRPVGGLPLVKGGSASASRVSEPARRSWDCFRRPFSSFSNGSIG